MIIFNDLMGRNFNDFSLGYDYAFAKYLLVEG